MTKVNEVARVVIEMQCTKLSQGLGPELVAVAIDKGVGGESQPSLIVEGCYQYSLISVLCDGRAADAVAGEVTVEGRRIKPENYIGLWRQAIDDRKSAQKALEEDGIEISLLVRGHLENQRGEKHQRTDDPMDGFSGWIEKFGDRMKVDADGYFVLELKGTEEGAAVAWFFMSGYRRREDKDARNESTMSVRLVDKKPKAMATEVADKPAQEALFI